MREDLEKWEIIWGVGAALGDAACLEVARISPGDHQSRAAVPWIAPWAGGPELSPALPRTSSDDLVLKPPSSMAAQSLHRHIHSFKVRTNGKKLQLRYSSTYSAGVG